MEMEHYYPAMSSVLKQMKSYLREVAYKRFLVLLHRGQFLLENFQELQSKNDVVSYALILF